MYWKNRFVLLPKGVTNIMDEENRELVENTLTSDLETESISNPDTDTDAETDAGTEVETESITETDTTETETDAETDAGTEVDASTETDAATETDAGTETDTTEIDASTETDTTEADAGTETDTTETDASTETDTTEADAATETDAATEADAGIETDTTEADASTETDTIEADAGTEVDAATETDASTEADAGAEVDAGIGADIGDDSFGDSVFETIDLTDSGDQTVQFTVDRDASFENEVGFYEVNENGSVIDPISGEEIAIGEVGYTEAALANSLDLALSTPNGQTSEFTTELSGGTQYGTFIVAEGTIEQLLDSDSTNDPAIYFGSAEANPENFDHIVSLGENTFGYEDFASGGDNDFNDMVVSYEFI